MNRTHIKITDYQLIVLMGVSKLLIHFATNTIYGLHRDEFLYFEMGKHLDWGYMEISPALPVLAKIAHWLGGSVFAIRLFPALIGSLKLVLCCLLAKELSG
ncbi:MAG: hypothetical protein OER04_14095, partial [Cyclobacteriaceae bacterium]|nr:hypothetical protein [Cyclobacteriaceae bacterium]